MPNSFEHCHGEKTKDEIQPLCTIIKFPNPTQTDSSAKQNGLKFASPQLS